MPFEQTPDKPQAFGEKINWFDAMGDAEHRLSLGSAGFCRGT
jgi:hypothetical protein